MKNKNRIREHHVLETGKKAEITFYWNNKPLKALKGEVIASALIANGIAVFGHHSQDNSPQGMFCANGQCAKCGVIANGVPVKSCMVEVTENMIVESMEGLPELPLQDNPVTMNDIGEYKTDILIIGGGPAGLSAAIELAKFDFRIILIDDKNRLGGKLVLQTHKFFGSVEDSYAGTRGIDIGEKLAEELSKYSNCSLWLNSTALFVFKDKKVGILQGDSYKIIEPRIILNTAGAREKFLRFPGNILPGIYGAGAFQTLVNRDLVKPSERLFIVGGGNVGLIAGYHALQAGITVVGLVEVMPACGGYKVHSDKLKRLGVPIYTSHTVISAQGKERVESVTIAEIDKNFQPLKGTEKTFLCDTILIAVGLEPLNEFTQEAETSGITVFSAGDANEIAEASSAMFNGKIAGLKVAKVLGAKVKDVPPEWYAKAEELKKEPGQIFSQTFPEAEEGVFPVIHCLQEIPCNPCATVCPFSSIELADDPLMGLPGFKGRCSGCMQCLTICPGLAITLVDYRQDGEFPVVTIPYEVSNYPVKQGDTVKAVDIDGNLLAELPVIDVVKHKKSKTNLVKIKAPKKIAKRIVSFMIQDIELTKPLAEAVIPIETADDAMVCLCERVKVGDVRALIRKGITDINQIKALTRLGMGPCGSKTCDTLIRQIFREEGVSFTEIVANTKRPVFIEAPLKNFVDSDRKK
jgi:NADPH-dependent 2,4-dienoyl-CoA reductase/sulfur reductase-like enzyme/Fe-S-cluster-containing hydrogenase component 2/bacterioferritin-associated ferredoxin